MEKTNAMRILDQKKIKYQSFEYPHEEGVAIDGASVAKLLGEDPNIVYKTLVTVDNTKHYHVCCIPVLCTIDLKKAAQAFRVKSLELIAVKELLPLTGYVRGGCSLIGMKKLFPTIVHQDILNYDNIIFSGGKIGTQIMMNPNDLSKVIKVEFKDIIKE